MYREKYGTHRQRQGSFLMMTKSIPVHIDQLLPDSLATRHDMNELQLFLICLFGECRGEPEEGIQHVAQCIINRSIDERKRFGEHIRDVLLQPQQFSYFNRDNINYRKEIENDILGWNKVCTVGIPIYIKPIKDIPYNMLNYFNPKIVSPKWAKNLNYYKDIGNHRFFTEGKPDFIV